MTAFRHSLFSTTDPQAQFCDPAKLIRFNHADAQITAK